MDLVLVKSYWTKEEKEDGKAKAKQLGLSFSDFVRRTATGARLPNVGHAETIRDLMKINADLARLGNLLKLAIDEEQPMAVLELADQVKSTQDLLKQKIKEL
ncbi:MAG: hypothetical protein HWE30_17775 [Methylocystaceae bacterium]|nr:hypothetical protein [Methylocystaceae bacterium]